MLTQFNVFVVLANLLLGTWVVFSAFQASRTFRYPYLKWFAYYCLAKLFFISHTFIWRYITVNVNPDAIENINRTLENVNDLVFSLVALASFVLMFRTVLGLRDSDFTRPIRWLIYGAVSLVVIGYSARILWPWGERAFAWFDVVARYVTIWIAYYEVLPAVFALVLGYRESDRGKALLLKGFGWIFVLRHGLLWFPSLLWRQGVQGGAFEAVYIPALLLGTLVPYMWLRCVFVPFAVKKPSLIEDSDVLDAVAEQYKISKRECEIISLILDGKSNKEIQDSLVVSIHTVKNHVYNIYKKLGVNSRYSLIHFITHYPEYRGK
jgi:DNA-binding CsgD family transcriptional regulator